MKIAVIKTGGKQYVVKEGQRLKVEKLAAVAGEPLEFDQVLLVADLPASQGEALQAGGEQVEIGAPTLNKKVAAKVLVQGRAKKVRVVKYKPKIRYHKVYGHRQPFTEVLIKKIG